jgi:hypothetical protein
MNVAFTNLQFSFHVSIFYYLKYYSISCRYIYICTYIEKQSNLLNTNLSVTPISHFNDVLVLDSF